MTVHVLPALSDNYMFLVEEGGKSAVIDPAEPGPVLDFMERLGVCLSEIWLTHHHMDHIAGVPALKEKTGCRVFAPKDPRIPNVDVGLEAGISRFLDRWDVQVIPVPGHTRTQLAYYLPLLGVLFSGDSLFAGGCGRLFEGTPQEMLLSLLSLAKLPSNTLVYSGHEYTESNLRFAMHVHPNCPVTKARSDEVQSMRQQGLPTVPSRLEEERATNPFLRVFDPAYKRALKREGASDLEVFSYLRALKDQF